MPDTSSTPLRECFQAFLGGGQAHAGFEAAVAEVPAHLRGTRPKGAEHSLWQLVEHARIAQWDILEFTRDPRHVSPEFPAGYWPAGAEPPDEGAWDRSLTAFRADLAAFLALIADPATDLLAPLPHAPDKTVAREALVLGDHNAYHAGQIVLLRRLLGCWPG